MDIVSRGHPGWAMVKKNLDQLRLGDGKHFEATISYSFREEAERNAFLLWYATEDHQSEEASQINLEPMDNKRYASTLLNVNWASGDSAVKLIGELYDPPSASYLEFPLGLDKDCTYFLQPELGDPEYHTDLQPGIDAHPTVYELRRVDGAPTSIKYGYFLGWLRCRWNDAAATKELLGTPFRVYLNIVDFSLWLIFDTDFEDDMGEPVSVSDDSDVWKYMPSLQDGRPSFKSLKVMDKSEIQNHDPSRSILGKNDLQSASDVLLRPFLAEEKAITEATRTDTMPSLTRVDSLLEDD